MFNIINIGMLGVGVMGGGMGGGRGFNDMDSLNDSCNRRDSFDRGGDRMGGMGLF